MRLKEFIEDPHKDDSGIEHWANYDQVATAIKKYCQPMLEVAGTGLKNLFYRGVRNSNFLKHPLEVRHVRQDRWSRDMPNTWSACIDDWQEQNLGVRGRSQRLFVSKSSVQASGYGNISIVLPIGEFNGLWSPQIKDMFSSIRAMFTFETDYALRGNIDERLNEYCVYKIDEFLRRADWQKNNFGAYFADKGSRIEMMLDCPNGYFLIPDKAPGFTWDQLATRIMQ